ncbi:MAG: dUTP diphosphatase [Patescibacteria group bacterium]
MQYDEKTVKIKRFDKKIPLPEYKTKGAAAFDLCARDNMEIPPKDFKYVPLNVAIETPPGYFLMLVARSSTHKKGLWMANGIGIGDSDFSGDNDEYNAVYYNFTDKPVLIEKGERIAQGLILKRLTCLNNYNRITDIQNNTRGGWGTTGKK